MIHTIYWHYVMVLVVLANIDHIVGDSWSVRHHDPVRQELSNPAIYSLGLI